jgi:hypothetical protein
MVLAPLERHVAPTQQEFEPVDRLSDRDARFDQHDEFARPPDHGSERLSRMRGDQLPAGGFRA